MVFQVVKIAAVPTSRGICSQAESFLRGGSVCTRVRLSLRSDRPAIALPIGVLAVAIAIGAKSSTRLLAAIQTSQGLLWAATATMILFVGIYLVWTLSFGLAN